jgi:hypothetical protein
MKDFAWGKFGRLVDIGGAYGSVLASLMGQYPRVSAVLFDQEKVRILCIYCSVGLRKSRM